MLGAAIENTANKQSGKAFEMLFERLVSEGKNLSESVSRISEIRNRLSEKYPEGPLTKSPEDEKKPLGMITSFDNIINEIHRLNSILVKEISEIENYI